MVSAGHVSTSQWFRAAGILGLIYVLPVVLVATGVIPFEFRFYVLVLMTLMAAGLALTRHSAKSLGFTMPSLAPLLGWSVLPAAGFTLLVLFGHASHRVLTPAHLAFYFFFVFVSAPAQEFLYRSFLFAEMRAMRLRPGTMVLLSGGLFGFMHIIYRDPLTVGLTLAAGFVWAMVFHSTRKVGIVALSHAMLGAAAIVAGVV